MLEHSLYGIKVCSEVPLLAPSSNFENSSAGQPSLELREIDAGVMWPQLLNRYPFYHAHGRNLVVLSDREPARSEQGQPWCLEVTGVVSFCFYGGERTVYFELHEEGNRALLVFWFVHIFLPLYLTVERGLDFMHGAMVEVDARRLAFLAPSTGGKSTLAAHFLTQGCALVTDDKLATLLHDGQITCFASHPYHRPYRQFEVLGERVVNFSAGEAPVHAFYLLEKNEASNAVHIEEVQGVQKFARLMPNYLFAFPFLQKSRMQWLAALADNVNVYRVSRPWGKEFLHETYSAICEHSASH